MNADEARAMREEVGDVVLVMRRVMQQLACDQHIGDAYVREAKDSWDAAVRLYALLEKVR